MLGCVYVWYCGNVLDVIGMKISCKVGCVFPIREYEYGLVRLELWFLFVWALYIACSSAAVSLLW